MNKVILLCAAGIMSLSVAGCDTCCNQPCCPPAPVAVYDGPVYAPHHHAHHPKHHKHHKAHHKAKEDCPELMQAKPAPVGK